MESKLIFIIWVAYYPWVESWNIKDYGCTFIDENYSLGRDLLSSWGDRVKPLEISNLDDLLELKDNITTINRKVISSNLYNSVDNLLKFLEDYKEFNPSASNSSGSNPSGSPRQAKVFADFYNSYRPKFRPHENFVGMSIDVLKEISNTLSEKWENISNHIYISSVQIQEIESDSQSALKQKDRAPTTKEPKNVMDRPWFVLATVKFSLQNRLGYLLIDPGYYNTFKEIIVMEDGKSPHNEPQLDESNNGTTQYFVHETNKDYIISRHTNSTPFLFDSKRVNFVVYVGQAFCSFIETTAKIELLQYYRMMAKRDSDGWTEGGFYFRALPETKHYFKALPETKPPVEHRAVYVFIHPKGQKRLLTKLPLTEFDGPMEDVLKNISTDIDLFAQVAKLLNMTSETLVMKIKNVQEIYYTRPFLYGVHAIRAKIEASKKKDSSLGNLFKRFK